MNANDPEFYQASKFDPVNPEAPRGRGCFFYGCVFAGVGMLIVMILCGVGGFFMYRTVDNLVAQYTGTEPRKLPKLEISKEKRAELKDRVAAFRKALDNGEETSPLELSSEDVNALIDENGDFKDKIYVTLEGDKIKGQISLPLDKIGENIPIYGRLLIGRYLNGEADLKVLLKEGVPTVVIDGLEVNGKTPPEEMMTSLRNENLAKDALKDPKNAELIRKIESVEVKDGKLVVKAHPKARRTGSQESSEKPKPGPDAKPAETKSPSAAAPSAEPKKDASAPPAKPAAPEPPKTGEPPAKKAA